MNAPAHERVWIDDIYQNIFCNAGEGVRQQATGRVAEWRNRYGRRQQALRDKDGLDELTSDVVRTCANGELVQPMGAIREVTTPSPASAPPPAQGIDADYAVPPPAPPL